MKKFIIIIAQCFNLILTGCVSFMIMCGISANHSQPSFIYVLDDPTVGYVYGKIPHFVYKEELPKQITMLVLDSPGGNLPAAINLREQVIERKIITYVPVDAICMSACTVIYGAGDYRGADPTALFGFHSPSYAPNLSLNSNEFKEMTESVTGKSILNYTRIQYAKMMMEDGLSEDFIDGWINKNEMTIFTAEQMKKLGFVDDVRGENE